MKAFWTIVQAIQQVDTWRPNIPDLPSVTITNPLDINRLLPNPVAGVNHTHLITGGIATASDNDGANGRHEHFVIYSGSAWIVHARYAVEHVHLGVDTPDFFMCFVSCSDSDFTTLTTAPHSVPVLCQAAIDEEAIGDLLNTAWTTGQHTAWVNAALNYFGITLPEEIDSGKRLVIFLLGMLQSRRSVTDRGLR